MYCVLNYKSREGINRKHHSAQAHSKRSRGFEFCLNGLGRSENTVFVNFSNVEMAETLCLSDSDRSSSSDQSVPSRSNNRSLRIAEKERKKNEAEDSFVLALRYFSEGKCRT